MLTIKLAAAVAAGAGVFWLGWHKSRLLSARVETAEELFSATGRIRALLKRKCASKSELLAELPFENTENLDFSAETAVADFLTESGFPFGEKETDEVCRFVLALGGGTLEEQLLLTDAFADFWAETAENARREKAEKGRLSLSLGGLGGIAAIIILA